MQSQSSNYLKPQKSNPLYLKKFILRMKIQQMLKIWKKKSKKSRHRVNILKEWEATQQSYIKDLDLIVNKIQKPLQDAALITEEQDRVMFPNLDAMIKLSHELLAQIKGFLKTWSPHKTMIGASLINFHKYFIIYREYCNNFYKSQKILKQLKKNPKTTPIFSSLLMDVQSYTIKPVQRPPKYQLLLRQYQKALPQSHPDHPILATAISKYHDVNEQNNQSMDLQIRSQKMIELDKKYGGIINVARIYLFEEYAKSIQVQGRLKIYVFSDLVLVVRVQGEGDREKEYGWKRAGLDGGSFVDAPMDGKYLINKLFICGTNDNFHLNFVNSATRDKVQQRFEKIIHELHRKQSLRSKGKNKAKMTIMKIQQVVIKPIPKVRITVVGVQKRPKALMNLNININISFETFYILKIQSPFPQNIFQYTYIKFDHLIALEQKLRSMNKMISIPILDDRPEEMNLYDAKKNKTKIIECRQIYIQRFVNYVLRSEELIDCVDLVVKELRICEEFWEFVSGLGRDCTCQVCESSKEDDISVDQYQQKTQYIRSMINPFLGLKSTPSLISQTPSYRDSISSTTSKSTSICLYNTMTLPTKILKTQISQLQSLSRRIAWLQSKLGRIDYSLLPHSQIEEMSITQNNIKVNISLLSLRDNQNIKVRINRKMTVLEVLDQIAGMYQVKSMRDFGLFMEYPDASRMLDRDEKLWEVLNDIGYQFQQMEEIKPKVQQSSFWKTFSNIKKWGSEIILGKKQKLYIRKYIFVNEEIEIQACQENPQRYSLIVEEIFYRFKNQLLILGQKDTKKFCALYYVVSNMDKLAHLNQANFQTQKLKTVLPQSTWHLIQSEQFQRQVFNYIREYEDLMQNTPRPSTTQRTSRSNSNSSTMFARIEVIYNTIIKLVDKALGWSTMFFDVTNYDPATLPGACTNLLLGVNRKNLVVIRHKQLEPLLQIPLQKLECKVSVNSIFIDTEEKVLRFDGQIMYDIKKLIEIYRQLGDKFGYQ